MYKVAELLGLSSQEAMTLLKSETGIDVKSASSSIEEIVARQFVERQARKRQISLPTGPLFADSPALKKPAGKGGKAPEPPKPAGPVMRPRLVKVHRPAAADGDAAELGEVADAHMAASAMLEVEAVESDADQAEPVEVESAPAEVESEPASPAVDEAEPAPVAAAPTHAPAP